MKAYLILEDGSFFEGESFGSEKTTIAEVVFNTGLTGYQEILTDPSYCGQIVNMTYPLIGNYGTNRDDFESIRPFVSGFLVRDYCEVPSNWRSNKTFSELLKSFDIPAISGLDTRRLTRKIREHGTMKAAIFFDLTKKDFYQNEILKDLPRNQVEQVSVNHLQHYPGSSHRIALLDYGCKRGILKELLKRNCEVFVLPYNTTAKEIFDLDVDGVLLSNGPGDPRDLNLCINEIQKIIPKLPTFGICLGHQLLALASGAEVRKMKFGHRGSNHPVKDLESQRVYISSQNHSYEIVEDSLKTTDFEVSHIAVNDKSIEGLKHKNLPVFSVQYHPEASPGPDDNSYLFDRFLSVIPNKKKGFVDAIT